MKKFAALVLAGIMMLSSGVLANGTALPAVLKTTNKKYEAAIEEAIENSKFAEEEIDKENIFIIEKENAEILDGTPATGKFYVALPSIKTDDIRFASFYDGAYKTEGMNTLSWLEKAETHRDTKLESYISENGLENVAEATNMILIITSGTGAGRASVNVYKIKTDSTTYYVPYYIGGVLNPTNEEGLSPTLGKAYTEEELAALFKAEAEAFIKYKEATEKEQAEKALEEAKKEEEKYRPTISLDENGDEQIKVNGINLDDVLSALTEHIHSMGFASTVNIGIKTADTDLTALYRWQEGGNTNDVSSFAEGLFDELKTQITVGKPSSSEAVSHCTFALRHDEEDYKSVRHQLRLTLYADGAEIQVNKEDAILFKLKNVSSVIRFLQNYTNDNFDGFFFEKNDVNTPHIRGTLDGLTKTDIIEFTLKLPKDTDNAISEEVASPSSTLSGTFERYRENKYRSTYILSLSGNLGIVHFCTRTQSSLSGEEELFSNNIPVSFLNTLRYENGNIVEYKAGKEAESHAFKMVFRESDIAEVYFDGTACTDLKYTRLTEDTKLSDIYEEKNKEAVLRAAAECADTLYDFGLFKGTDKGYELEKSLTREESATILVRLLGEEENVQKEKYDAVFTDVDKGRWSYAYVMYCYENGITKGTGADTFSPDMQIDASQFTTLLLRLLGYTDVNPGAALTTCVTYQLLPEDKAQELANKEVFTRSDMVQIVYNSLKTKMEDETVFAKYLSEKGVLSESEIEQIK